MHLYTYKKERKSETRCHNDIDTTYKLLCIPLLLHCVKQVTPLGLASQVHRHIQYFTTILQLVFTQQEETHNLDLQTVHRTDMSNRRKTCE